MAAALLYLPANRAFNSNGIGVPGAVAELYLSGTTTPANFYSNSALSVSLGSSITANAAGRFSPAYQDETIPFRLIVKDASGAELDDIDPYYFGSLYGSVISTASTSCATRTALAGLTGTAGATAHLAENGREGIFVFKAAATILSEYGTAATTLVSTDTAQGFFVAPTTDTTGASGAWVRKFSGAVNVKWFGATGDGTTDDSAAITGAIALLKVLAVNNDGNLYKGSQRLLIPAGLYNLGTTTLDITYTLIIEGESSINGYSTRLKWTGDATGIRIQAFNTSGASTVDGANHFSGSYTILRGLALAGPYVNNPDFTGHTEGEYHGIHARSNYIIEDCLIDGFAGDGVHIQTTSGGGGADEGNSNCSFINRLKVTNVRNGVYIDGADANACTIIGVVGSYCRRWTVWDSSFLGNTHIGHHSANAGLIKGVASTVVSNGGNRYALKVGGNPANSPSGTTADTADWLYLAAGAADATLNIPAWSAGVSARDGGCYKTDSANAANQLIGLYNEGGEGPAQLVYPTNIVGGIWGTRDPVTTGNYIAGSKIVAPNPATFGLTTAKYVSGGTDKILTVHNSLALAATIPVRLNFSQGYETDGTTPCRLADIYAYSTTNNPATNEVVTVFATRAFSTGVMTDRVALDSVNATFRPITDNNYDLGLTSFRWKTVYAYAGNFSTSVTIGGGTALTKAAVYAPSLTPASVAAATVAEQTFTVSGLTTADKVVVNPPSIGNATGIAGARVSAADTLAIRFVNPTAGALTPTSGTYTVIAFRS